jgi:hypothetical protein
MQVGQLRWHLAIVLFFVQSQVVRADPCEVLRQRVLQLGHSQPSESGKASPELQKAFSDWRNCDAKGNPKFWRGVEALEAKKKKSKIVGGADTSPSHSRVQPPVANASGDASKDSAEIKAGVPETKVTKVYDQNPGNSDRRIALVIGNSKYQRVPVLPNPSQDAVLVADALKQTGFQEVTVLSNLSRSDMIGALRDFASKADGADWAVVYYAGHGMEIAGTNYLVPIDATIAVDRDVSFEAIPLDQVLNAVERAKRLHLVILDACRDNPFKNQMKRTMASASRSVTAGLAPVEPDAGTLVVYAAKDGETALDGDGEHSPYATAFVKDIKIPGLEVRRLFDVVRDDVIDLTRHNQKPFSYGSVSGRQEFYFVAPRS